MSGLGHNRGPTMEKGRAWRRYAWTRARSELMPTLPIEVARRRVRRARELGIDYKSYAGIRAAKTGGGVEMLAIISAEEFQHFMGVADVMRAEAHEKGMVEGVPSSQGLFALRRIALEEPLDDFFFDPEYRNLIGSSRDGGRGVVVNLNVGRPIRGIELPGLPHLGSGISWSWQGRPVMATIAATIRRRRDFCDSEWRIGNTLPGINRTVH